MSTKPPIYFDGRERDNTIVDEDEARICEVDKQVVELYHPHTAKMQQVQPETIVKPDKYNYPRLPTKNMADKLYLSGEIDELQYEQLLETVFSHEGIGWGEIENWSDNNESE